MLTQKKYIPSQYQDANNVQHFTVFNKVQIFLLQWKQTKPPHDSVLETASPVKIFSSTGEQACPFIMLNTSTHHFLIELMNTIGDWWQLFPCHQSSKLNGTLRIYSSPLLVHMCAWWEGTMFGETDLTPGDSPYTSKPDCSWLLWPLLRSFYKYSLVFLVDKSTYDTQRCPKVFIRMYRMLSPAYWCDRWGKKGKSGEDDCH